MTQLATRHKTARRGRPCESRRTDRDGRESRAAEQPAAPPPRHRLAVVTWIGAYSVITAILALLGPSMASWPLPLRTLLLSVLMVVTLTWVVLPLLNRAFRGWLKT